jgi:hypothetical protein
MCILGLLMDLNKTVVTAPNATAVDMGRMPAFDYATELHCYIAAPDEVGAFKERNDGRAGVFTVLSRFCVGRFNDAVAGLFARDFIAVFKNLAMCAKAIIWAFLYHTIYSLIYFAAVFITAAFAGGAICRMAALQLANNERPGLVQSVQFAKQKIGQLISAPLAPLVMILIFGFFIFVLGLIGNIVYAGELLAAVFLILALLTGFFIALVLIGLVGGFTLMFPVIAYEGSDSFDAISRSFSYVYARPWRMAFYTFMAAVYGAACYVFVRIFVFTLLAVTHGFLRLGLWAQSSQASGINKLEAIWPTPNFLNLMEPTTVQLSWSEGIAAFLIRLAMLVVFCLVGAFAVSFFFSANTIIYALMRSRVDNTPISEIYIQTETGAKVSTVEAELPTESQEPELDE